ncbi:MAG: exosome complex protein Rrp42 [Candidatus Marsarchaeota archaeon]|nr:exosome complex protein Rrp42 [Candidatus Marsarchaeota archaeon]MCL5102168.1 exosome complex protein Rrp42 [Candidatus Marsarchaeota archaeon]
MGALEIIKSDYIRELVAKGERGDGRKDMDVRDIKITTGTIDHAEGSAQVDLGNTRVLAGAKIMVDDVHSDTPDQGNIVVSAELLPLASAEYESGPPSPEAIELARVVDRGIRAGNCIKLEDLFLGEGKAWTVYVDVYVLNYDGNLFDASTLAAMSAIMNARIPEYKDGVANYENRKEPLNITNVVSSATFAKIGNSILLDPSGEEESAMDARLTIATDGNVIRAMQKGLSGSFTIEEVDKLAGIALEKHQFYLKHIEKAKR